MASLRMAMAAQRCARSRRAGTAGMTGSRGVSPTVSRQDESYDPQANILKKVFEIQIANCAYYIRMENYT